LPQHRIIPPDRTQPHLFHQQDAVAHRIVGQNDGRIGRNKDAALQRRGHAAIKGFMAQDYVVLRKEFRIGACAFEYFDLAVQRACAVAT